MVAAIQAVEILVAQMTFSRAAKDSRVLKEMLQEVMCDSAKGLKLPPIFYALFAFVINNT